MKKIKLKNHLSQDGLREQMLASKERAQFQRWQTILMASKGMRADAIAEYVGIATGTVYQWVFQYNHYGADKFVLEGRGGRRFGLMSLAEETKLLEELESEARKGHVVGAFAVRRQVENKLGKKVSKDYPYDLLHRHGWRKVVPRPEHPKADKKKQEEFKKTLPSCWKPPANVFLPKTIDR